MEGSVSINGASSIIWTQGELFFLFFLHTFLMLINVILAFITCNLQNTR